MNAQRRYLAPADPQWLGKARFWVGLFASVYLLIRLPHLVGYADANPTRFAPVGLCSWLPRQLHPVTVWAQSLAAPLAAFAFCMGWRFRLSGPVGALLVAWVLSYRNSFGMVFHTENLLVLHMVVLGLAPAADAWSVDARRRGGAALAPARKYGWPLRLVVFITLASYLVAGLAKLRTGGWHFDWASGELLRAHVAFDNLRKEAVGHVVAPLGPWLVQQGWAFGALAWATLVLELGAPLVWLFARLSRLWVVAVWGFHAGVLLTMAILFPYPLSGVAFVGLVRADGLWRRGPFAALASRAFGVDLQPRAGPEREGAPAGESADVWAPPALF